MDISLKMTDVTQRCVLVCVQGRVSHSHWRKVAAVSFTWFLFGRVVEGKLEQVTLAGCWLLAAQHAFCVNMKRLAVLPVEYV